MPYIWPWYEYFSCQIHIPIRGFLYGDRMMHILIFRVWREDSVLLATVVGGEMGKMASCNINIIQCMFVQNMKI